MDGSGRHHFCHWSAAWSRVGEVLDKDRPGFACRCWHRHAAFWLSHRRCALWGPHSFHGWIHLLAFYLFLASSTLACFFMWLRLRKDSPWRRYDWYSLGTEVLAVILFQFTMFYIVLVVLLTWLEVLAIRLWVITRRE